MKMRAKRNTSARTFMRVIALYNDSGMRYRNRSRQNRLSSIGQLPVPIALNAAVSTLILNWKTDFSRIYYSILSLPFQVFITDLKQFFVNNFFKLTCNFPYHLSQIKMPHPTTKNAA